MDLENLGGAIEMESQVGEGTLFRMDFKALDEECSMPDDTPVKPVGGNEHLLVVDDEPIIADMLGKILGNLGYRVQAFSDPTKVPDAVTEHIDLLITNMTMPGMNGVVLTEKVRKIRPDLPVILMTGFSEAIDSDLARKKGIAELLYKPVGQSDIAASIRKALAGQTTD